MRLSYSKQFEPLVQPGLDGNPIEKDCTIRHGYRWLYQTQAEAGTGGGGFHPWNHIAYYKIFCKVPVYIDLENLQVTFSGSLCTINTLEWHNRQLRDSRFTLGHYCNLPKEHWYNVKLTANELENFAKLEGFESVKQFFDFHSKDKRWQLLPHGLLLILGPKSWAFVNQVFIDDLQRMKALEKAINELEQVTGMNVVSGH